ncbi:hypothetical protein B0H13DRAFT_1861757 [Mycena leptocephala]|nr:hypothetical protein B0H13DRAFT_1861757 [Mycena leptocephala]
MVKMVNVKYNGNSFAFPGGELLIQQDRISWVWITSLWDATCGYLLAPPAEPPTVFAVEEAEDGAFIVRQHFTLFGIKEPDSGLVWDVVYTEGSNVGRVLDCRITALG